jgi:hypothetical protein
MAKRKHSTALFEVITQPKSYAPIRERRVKSDGLLHTAGQWFKRTLQARPTQPSTPNRPAGRALVATPAADASFPVARATPLIESDHEPLSDSNCHDGYKSEYSVAAHDDSSDYFEPPEYADAPAPQLNSATAVAMALDHDRRQISLRMSYTAATISACALAVIVSLAIIAGQHISRSGAPLLAQTTSSKLREGPSHPEVLEPIRHNAGGTGSNSAGNSPTRTTPIADTHTPLPAPLPAVPAGDGKRYISLNYAIIQSYPLAEEKMARDAAAFLNNEGVPCTIERDVKGYLAISVVGLQSFERISTAPYIAYKKRIEQLSAKYATNNKSYKAFAPVAKSWGK